MSSEKELRATGTPGRARASWEQLQARWHTSLRVTEGTQQEPRIVELMAAETVEVWKWIGGSGAKALFERMEG